MNLLHLPPSSLPFKQAAIIYSTNICKYSFQKVIISLKHKKAAVFRGINSKKNAYMIRFKFYCMYGDWCPMWRPCSIFSSWIVGSRYAIWIHTGHICHCTYERPIHICTTYINLKMLYFFNRNEGNFIDEK